VTTYDDFMSLLLADHVKPMLSSNCLIHVLAVENTKEGEWLLSELYRKFSKPLHVAYVDIKAAFDSVDREALWKALQAKYVPPFLISLIKDLHTGTKSCVRVGRSCTAPFPTSSGVRQGCVLVPALFRIAIDWIMSMCADKAGVNVGQSMFRDIDYADGAVLFAEDDTQWTSILESFDAAANKMGLHTSWSKTKIQNVASGPSPPSCVSVSYQDIKWKRSIGSHISAVMLTHRATVHQKCSGGSA